MDNWFKVCVNHYLKGLDVRWSWSDPCHDPDRICILTVNHAGVEFKSKYNFTKIEESRETSAVGRSFAEIREYLNPHWRFSR